MELTPPPSPSNVNPPLVFQELQFRGKTFFVVRDDLLPAGTKGRAMVDFMKQSPATDFIYAGPVTGYAQIVLSYAAAVCDKRAHLFVEKREPRSSQTERAIYYGGRIIEMERPVWLSKLQEAARELYLTLQAQNGPDSAHFFELGFHHETYIQLLADKVRAAVPASLLARPPARLWLTCGSATVLHALVRVFPTTHYLVVQVGRNLWPDLFTGISYTKFVAPERFYQETTIRPPYPSVAAYDAKLWQFVQEHGEDGDFIWNVGCDTPAAETTPQKT